MCLITLLLVVISHGQNKRNEDHQARKLDRVLNNEEWLLHGPASTVEFLAPGTSDHSPTLLCICDRTNSGKKSFKFFNYWTDHPRFFGLVDKV